MELNVKQLIAQIVNFLILFFLLRKFFWKPFLTLLENRRQKIVAEFQTIDTTKAEINALKNDYEQKLSVIEETARNKMQEMIHKAEAVAQDIQQKAQEDTKRLMEQTQKDIKLEILKAKQELRKEVVDLTIKATENLIEEKLTPGVDAKLVEKFLTEMDARHG